MKTKSHTETIKCTFRNAVHKLLNPNHVKNSEKWKMKPTILSTEEKAKLYDEIVKLDSVSTRLLGKYWYERREKKRVQRAREKKLTDLIKS